MNAKRTIRLGFMFAAIVSAGQALVHLARGDWFLFDFWAILCGAVVATVIARR